MTRPSYPAWVRSRRVFVFWALSVGLLSLGMMSLWLSLLATPFLFIALVLSLSTYRLSAAGDDVQARVHRLISESVGGEGRVLDVGCGSGQLIISLAKRSPGEHVGLDYWGDDWEFSQVQAEYNAQLEGVNGVRFVRGSASQLPFRTAGFQRVVSCLTFHEVATGDKTACVTEALRVLQPGGRFAFVDLFDSPEFFGSRQRVVDTIAATGALVDDARNLSELMELRFPLRMGKVLGHAVLISGRKA